MIMNISISLSTESFVFLVIYTVGFNQLTHTVHEDSELVQLTLVLDKSSSYDITVQVITTDGSAIGKSKLSTYTYL